MQFEEETLEILEPNAAMSPILKALDAALAAHTGPDPQPPREFAWEEIPFAEVARTAAAFPLLFEGWPKALFPQPYIPRASCCMNCPRTLTS